MAHDGNHSGDRRAIVTLADLEKEFRRLQESKMRLVSLAADIGLAVPRSCCLHPGEAVCLSCAADWLVAYTRSAKR